MAGPGEGRVGVAAGEEAVRVGPRDLPWRRVQRPRRTPLGCDSEQGKGAELSRSRRQYRSRKMVGEKKRRCGGPGREEEPEGRCRVRVAVGGRWSFEDGGGAGGLSSHIKE